MSSKFKGKEEFTNIILVVIIIVLFGIVVNFIISQKPETLKTMRQSSKDIDPVPLGLKNVDENTTITGLVIENNRSCLIDGQCFLTLNTDKGELTVLYNRGRSTTPYINIGITEGALEIKNGTRVEVYGKAIGTDFISVCDSKEFYIKKLK